MQVVLLELNEVNFDHLAVYAANGEAPNLARLIDTCGIARTTSEASHEMVEPWIQWVTAHTGMAYSDHKVFRLGDIVKHDLKQIWEHLEEHGLRIGAVSPMNAKNRTRNAAFFIPDPWTATHVTGGALAKRLYSAVAQAVNDNAQSRLVPTSVAWLVAGAARYARPMNYALYASLAGSARAKPWRKSMLLDLLFSDLCIRETLRTQPSFVSLFLNGAAHIQHHYMFNSRAYDGDRRNPEWYIARAKDPVGEVYRLYDRIVGQIQAALPNARLLIATGLHQDPDGEATFYWRLKDHANFLRKIGVPFERVEPLMSRDFMVRCATEGDAHNAERILGSARSPNGAELFEVDNRGRDLFVMLTWPENIPPDFVYTANGRRYEGLLGDVSFVAIKNGQHNGIGYFIDTAARAGDSVADFPLKELPSRVCHALGAPWSPVAT